MTEQEKKGKKDAGCVYCEHIFDCKGKPPEVKLCVNFKERKKHGKIDI